jgi:hypothetical protein
VEFSAIIASGDWWLKQSGGETENDDDMRIVFRIGPTNGVGKMPEDRMTVSEVAERLGVRNPSEISTLIYTGVLDKSQCPLVKRKRRIPAKMLPSIKAALIERGVLSER